MLSLSDILNKKRCAVSLPPQKKTELIHLGAEHISQHKQYKKLPVLFNQPKLTETITGTFYGIGILLKSFLQVCI